MQCWPFDITLPLSSSVCSSINILKIFSESTGSVLNIAWPEYKGVYMQNYIWRSHQSSNVALFTITCLYRYIFLQFLLSPIKNQRWLISKMGNWKIMIVCKLIDLLYIPELILKLCNFICSSLRRDVLWYTNVRLSVHPSVRFTCHALT